jgi:hypothetical protein
MGLSRLDNFLKSSRGTILYVDPNSLDATDSIENQGNSLTRPFKTIQRALIESARFSYQRGLNNDRFGKTTILLYPGDHLIDNRPGYIPDGLNNFRLRDGTTTNNLPAFDLNSNFDLTSPDNELHKLNSIYGGVILPRGTSLVGLDLRKTKVRPKYVPNPENDDIERSAVFRVTGVCYIWQFTLFDSDPNGVCYKDYTNNTFVPNFSHHKLACFEYADGTNDVKIEDTFQTYSTDRTDLDMYYEKISLVYGQSSGRAISPDYPSSGLDIQPKIDEFRIVGSTGQSIGITSIKAGNGIVATTNITVTTTSAVDGLDVDTPFRVSGITAAGYNGQFVVSEKTSSTQIVYQVQNAPISALPSVTGATLSLQSDTVTSASPYIFNVSLRSVFGMCGLIADGSKASGFKSMVVAQFTAVGLQKDDNAFVKYNSTTGAYEDNSTAITPLSNDSRAVFKPSYKNFHIKATNNSVIQAVSVFAIGFAEHFVTENGGDQSITNSNSNFGAKSLVADGFRNESFAQDDLGYITHIIPPKEVPLTESSIEFSAIDVLQTVGIASTAHLYLYAEKNLSVPPENVIEGYRIGTRVNDTLKVLVASAGSATEYSSRIVMPGSQSSSEKSFNVSRSAAGINSIGAFSSGGTSNVLTFTQSHTLLEGESIRILSDNGHLPDGLTPNIVYFAITSGLTTTTNIKIAKTLNDALNGTPLNINANGGALKVVSRVSDKNSGDIGHPIQYDTTNSQWFIKVASASTENSIYSTIVGLGSTGLGDATTRTYFKRKSDNRSANDTLYRVRYVIPKTSASGINARPPVDGFILQESNTSIGSTSGEIQTYFGTGSLGNVNQQRNFRIISNAEWTGAVANITTELPHNLIVGSQVELVNIKSTNNTIGASKLGFNETYSVTGISSAKQFSVALATNPGTFTNDTSARTTALPYFKRKRYETTYYVYRFSEGQEYISGEQDGIYYFTLVNSSNKPTVTPFNEEKYSQPVKELFPQINRDNPTSDPAPTKCFAQSELIGEVVVNDVRSSITKETVNKLIRDTDVGVGIVNITSATGTAHTITTSIDHGLNKVTGLTITNGGTGYGSGTAGDLYNARLVGIGTSVTGLHASAKITVDSAGTITAIKIMDGGSAYGIGNTLAVVGVSTFAPFVQSVVTVSSIYNNVGDTLRVVGVQSEGYADYNDLYRITGVNVGGATSITVSSASTVSNSASTGLGVTLTSGSYLYLTGEAIRINSLVYTASSGIATVVTANSHGLKVDQKVRFTGANQNQYLGSFVVTQIFDVLAATPSYSFSVNIGIGTTAPTATGTLFAFREGYTSNNGGITLSNENLNGRMIPSYAGITTTLAADIITAATDQISITGIANLDVNIGDYFMIDDEIVRVKTTTTGSNPVSVFRGILGTKPTIHFISSTIRKININPVELRRHSISRASGHTFEYVGFGPGNYSTALPDKQDRAISSEEELLSQSTRRDGGINFYTGMNDKGISYSGNRKINTTTGVEEIFDTPVQTITGDDIGVLNSINVINPLEGSFSRSIRVEGGDNNTAISEFNGPVIVTSKFTSTSNKGIEANSLYLQGDAIVARNYTVAISTPSLAGNPGDIAYYSDPNRGGYVGWVYTLENEWYRFGNISISETENHMIFDRVGIATTSAGTSRLVIGAGSSLFSVDATGGVGIGTTANQYKLNVNGNTNIGGTITASYFSGDGSSITNVNVSAAGWTQISGGIYNTALNNVGIGTSVPRFNLELGAIGTSSTSLHVNGTSTFIGLVTTGNVLVGGALTSLSSYQLNNISSGVIRASSIGIGTTNPLTSLQIGTASTLGVPTNGHIFAVTGIGSVGIGTTVPRAHLDVEGHTKLKTYSENVEYLTVVSNIVTVDLSKAQSFICTATANITQFTLTNVPSGSTEFTLRIDQDSTGSRTVGIDTFKTPAPVTIPIYWPGGVIPVITPTANKTDIYSFKTFDGNNITGSGLYGVVVGQNFSN